MDKQLEILKNFICSDSLEELEREYFNRFNIFNAVGMTKQEIRHSNFLSWLFNPNENHGLGEFFIKNFLKEVLISNENLSVNNKKQPDIFKIDIWDMSNTVVERERDNTDILFIDRTNDFICVIENKIESKQGQNQLTKYLNLIEKYDYKWNMFIYLKPEKDEEINPKYNYASYKTIIKIIDKLFDIKGSYINSDILLVIKHYKELLEREIMKDDEKLKEICQEIYNNHKAAINLIIDNIDTNFTQTIIAETLKKQLKDLGYKTIGTGTRNIIFAPDSWCDGYTAKRVYFNICNSGGINKKYCLYIDAIFDSRIENEKQIAISKCWGNNGNKKRVGTILSKSDLEDLCKYIDENGEINNENEEKLKQSLHKCLCNINFDEIKQIIHQK